MNDDVVKALEGELSALRMTIALLAKHLVDRGAVDRDALVSLLESVAEHKDEGNPYAFSAMAFRRMVDALKQIDAKPS